MKIFIHSYRKYKDNMFKDAYKACEGKKDEDECKRMVRDAYRSFESGRWWEAMNSLHKFLCALDMDEIKRFKMEYPKIVDRVNEWAVIEEMREI